MLSTNDAVEPTATPTKASASPPQELGMNTSHDFKQQDDPSRENDSPEPTDIPRLRGVHVTAGYRDGISNAKAASVQAGFDEGYALGAEMALVVGELMGRLHGIVSAAATVAVKTAQSTGSYAALAELQVRAEKELSEEMLFGVGFFAPDGLWIYPVEGSGVDGGEVSLVDVVRAHPSIRKWTCALREIGPRARTLEEYRPHER